MLAEVALRVAHQDQAAFATTFIRVTGTRPAQWRHAQPSSRQRSSDKLVQLIHL
jgi:AraC-like DNA-binding protein